MATIKPFRAWHYDAERVSMERVVAPPYDIISEEEESLFRKHDPHNVIRLILGQSKPGRPRSEQAYDEAGLYLREWTKTGILTHPPRSALYLHEETFQHPFEAKTLTRIALFAALRLEPFERKIVFRHEQTYATAKEDRAKLLRATQCNFSPIFILYEDSAEALGKIHRTLIERAPLFDFREAQAIRHRLWVIDGAEEIKTLMQTFDQRRVFIADGHHRYETALAYAHERNGKAPILGAQGWDYVLSVFVQFNDPGLLILPIHRLVSKLIPVDRGLLAEGLKRHFVLHSVSKAVLEQVSRGSIGEGFGLAFSESECYLLELKDRTWARQMMPGGKPDAWYDLDVNLISYLVLEPLLGIDTGKLERSIVYAGDPGEVFEKLKVGEAVCAFLMRPIHARMIKEICEGGELMPQKSTYFYPKFPSGLLMYRHGEGSAGVGPGGS